MSRRQSCQGQQRYKSRRCHADILSRIRARVHVNKGRAYGLFISWGRDLHGNQIDACNLSTPRIDGNLNVSRCTCCQHLRYILLGEARDSDAFRIAKNGIWCAALRPTLVTVP